MEKEKSTLWGESDIWNTCDSPHIKFPRGELESSMLVLSIQMEMGSFGNAWFVFAVIFVFKHVCIYVFNIIGELEAKASG